ncbi:uncharacterized protein LOC115796313 [Archocentrus centrarchus]|uniref:uncharacterized protein LOC115796313 n=1 Tax=Archocentrus centrarchus TaxID=63155 RepID=UPI0011EA1528|nr:uncharacterized protein LOC115796313 [Archocentrus centrarchus]
MGCILHLAVILWTYSCKIQGLQHVFVQHEKDLHLDVQKPVELDKKTDLFWKFNTSNYVGKIGYSTEAILFDGYEGRAELFKQNYSLILKTVQHNDSGDYIGIVTGGQERRVAEYKVTVQDPVSPVDLTVTSSGSDSCIITVTCSTADLKISRTFRCDAQNCSQVEEKSLKATKNFSSLIIYLQQDTIVCNHSNQVSWKQSKVTKLQCEPKPETNNTVVIVIVIVIVIVGVILAAIVYSRQRKKGMYDRESRENTVYAVPEVVTTPCLEQNLGGDASVSASTSTYCLVGSRAGPTGSTEPKDKALPESLYAQIQSHPRSKTSSGS